MAPDAGTPRRPFVGRLILRILLVVALVVLLALNGVKHAPAIAAALTPATTAPVAAGTSATPATTSTASASASASASATVTSGSSGSGGGSGSDGGTTTTQRTTPKPSVDSLDATSVACPAPDAPVNAGGGMSPTTTVSWSTSNAKTVYFGVDTDDAQANPYSQVSSSGSIDVHWPCADATDEFAITAVGSDGTKTTKTITAKNSGYTD